MHFRTLIVLLFGAALTVPLVGSSQSTTTAKTELNTTRWYPFRVDEKGLTAQVNVADAKVEQYYGALFRKYGYMGTALTWDSMVAELISKNDVDFMLNNDLDLTASGNIFTITASSKEELERAMNVIQPTFAVISKLEAFVKSVNPAHIKDGHPEPR